MAFGAEPPSHVTPLFKPVYESTFQFGGLAWTICYILIAREGLRRKTYGMPLFALANNFAWEMVYALYVVDSAFEKTAMVIWMLIDTPIIYSVLKHGKTEWHGSRLVKGNLKTIFGGMVAICALAHWCWQKWWIENEIGRRDDLEGADLTQMAYWAVSLCQFLVSTMSLSMLCVRGHSGGASWMIWLSRFLGTLIGLNFNYAWAYYTWPEAHSYFVSAPAVFIWGMTTVCDVIYACVLFNVRKTETELPDGRKIAPEDESEQIAAWQQMKVSQK